MVRNNLEPGKRASRWVFYPQIRGFGSYLSIFAHKVVDLPLSVNLSSVTWGSVSGFRSARLPRRRKLIEDMTLRTIKGVGGQRRRRHSIRSIVALGAVAGVLGMMLPASANTPTGGAQYSYIPVLQGDATYNGARDVLVNGSFVYWTNTASGTIGRANTDGTGINQSFITGLNTPSGLATDGTSLYWSNIVSITDGTSAIGKTALDGSGVPDKIFITGASRPIGLAVGGGFIYWANYGTRTIGRATITGGSVNQSFIALASRPYGLAVNATNIFWANFEDNAGTGVGQATIAGTITAAAFIPTSSAPTGLAVDATHVYWSNFSSNTIGRANLDASSPNQSWLTGATGPVGIDVNATHLYWSNYDTMPPTVARTAFDFTAPLIAGPSSFTAVATTPSGTTLTYATPVSATDPDDTGIVPTCNVGTLTGGTFPLGNTVVNCDAVDPVGNAAITKTFTVTVNLPPAPVLTLSPNLNVTATSLAGAIVTYAAPTSTSGTPTCLPASGIQYPIGVTTVMCMATDTTGQTTNGSFTITVTKPGFPTFSPNPLPNQVVTATSPAGAVVTYASPTASAGTPSCAPASGTTFPIGMTTVTCTTTDNLAQTTTATFMVTVNKPAAPVLTLPSNQSATATSAAGVAVTYPAATATSGTPTCAPASGAVFPVGVTTVTCSATDGFAQTTTGTFTVTVAPVPTPVAATPPASGNPAAEPALVAVAATTTVAPTTTATPTTTVAPVVTTKPAPASAPTTTAPIVAVVAPSTKVLPATAVIEEPTFTG